MVTRVREKGQITLPAYIREALHLSKDSTLSIAKVGEAILLTPRPLSFDTIADKFEKQAKKNNVSLDDLLRDLKKLRKS